MACAAAAANLPVMQEPPTEPGPEAPGAEGAARADLARAALRSGSRSARASRRRPGRLRRALAATLPSVAALALLGWGGAWLLTAPDTPLAPEWNPTLPLDLARPASPFTGFKLRRAARAEASCLAALGTFAGFQPLPPFDAGGGCGIGDRVRLASVGAAALAPVETSCRTALRLAAWQRHVVPEAAEALGAPVAGLLHQGSYNCRPIRGGGALSSHARAGAIDIRGVVLADGRRLVLLGNWEGDGPEARFWRALRDGGCDWFGTVLGPEFDANHADHLHLQWDGRGTCR
jgi:hypothetical protein